MENTVMKFYLIVAGLLLVLLIQNCNHGIEPAQQRTAISGMITYQNWPPADSLIDLRLVAFKEYPPADIFFEVTSGQAVVYPAIGTSGGLPLLVETTAYTMDLPPGDYAYLVVAQQYGNDITTSWRAVGQYDTTGTGMDSIPTALQVIENKVLSGIDIQVDFHNLPYQPFVE
jgi:hypothetical protein